MEIAIERFVALSIVVIGLSHLFQPRMWVDFFVMLRAKGDAGVALVAFTSFPIGALIVSFHQVWEGLPMIVTILGWGWTIKGALYFIFPALGRRMLQRVSPERAWEFAVAGGAFLLLGGLLIYSLLNRGGVVS